MYDANNIITGAIQGVFSTLDLRNRSDRKHVALNLKKAISKQLQLPFIKMIDHKTNISNFFTCFFLLLIALPVGIVQSSGYITVQRQVSNIFNNY